MSVQITINGADAAESIRELAALAAGITGVSAPAAQPESKPSKPRTKPEQPKTEKAAPPAESEDNPVEDDVDTVEEADSDEPVPTDDELRKLAKGVGDKGADAKKAIKGLLNKYGVPNITAVPDNKRIAFKRELEAL